MMCHYARHICIDPETITAFHFGGLRSGSRRYNTFERARDHAETLAHSNPGIRTLVLRVEGANGVPSRDIRIPMFLAVQRNGHARPMWGRLGFQVVLGPTKAWFRRLPPDKKVTDGISA